MTFRVEVGDGAREYILIDREREQIIRCEAEGVTLERLAEAFRKHLHAQLTGHGGYELSILGRC